MLQKLFQIKLQKSIKISRLINFQYNAFFYMIFWIYTIFWLFTKFAHIVYYLISLSLHLKLLVI